MWGIISTIFLGVYCFMSYYIGRRGWAVLGNFNSPVYRRIYWGFFGLLVLTFPAAEIGEDFLPATGGYWLTIGGWYSMVAVVYIFLFVLVIDLFRLVDRVIGFVPVVIKEQGKTPPILAASVLVLVIITLIFGTWNARNPIVTEYQVTVNKKAGSLDQLRIAMVSDIHYGTIIDASRLNRMVELVNELQPDVILFAGDLTEGNPTLGEMRGLMNVFSKMEAKFGKFAVPGNHDRVLREDNQMERYFKEAGVQVLKDRYIKVGQSFYVIGRDNPRRGNQPGRQQLDNLMEGVDVSLPLILLDHQPINLEEARTNGIDLQLSGHTHKGQIFPSGLITGQIYELDWGLLNKENYNLIVSSGFGTWGPPLRIGNHPEVVSVSVKFARE